MSVGSWFFILCKAIDLIRTNHHAAQAWQHLRSGAPDGEDALFGDLGRLLRAAQDCHRQWLYRVEQGGAATVVGDPVERVLSQTLGDCVVHHERGLTFLACVAAGAPFVGLFGTVMGIYHALAVIGSSGEAGLSQVAGPVGEALLMTACGLACAIPAVLAYNLFVRLNRTRLADMERFAHQLHAQLTLGAPLSEAA
jgi:biopolymer transport protein ExbB